MCFHISYDLSEMARVSPTGRATVAGAPDPWSQLRPDLSDR